MKQNILILLFSFLVFGLQGQSVLQLGDINPGSENSAPFNDNAAIYHNGNLYFSADDGVHGDELWMYDGSEVSLLKDINEGPDESEIQNMMLLNGVILFVADTETSGTEFWTTDGTEAGTQLLTEIGPGDEDGVYISSFNANSGFFVYNNELFFTGIEDGDFELWKTNGTAGGTMLVKNIASFGDSFPDNYVEFKGEVYFSCREGLWKTDGTSSGTVLVEDDDPEDVFGLDPDDLFATDDLIYMFQKTNLWVSDGTSSGTKKIMDFENVSLNWSGVKFSKVNGTVVFPANDGITGEELWRTDGTTAGTQLVKDVWPGSDGYAPQNTVSFNDLIYYKGDDGESDIELFVTDGTTSGTNLFFEFDQGFGGGFSLPTNIIADDNFIYMGAGKSFAKELWYTDGVSDPIEIDINPNGESRPNSFYLFDDKLFCFAGTEDDGFEPYIIDVLSTAVDADNDGFTDDVDCDDSNAEINPGQSEIPYNGIDDDCDPSSLDDDLDQDGFNQVDDCDDNDAGINPGADDIPNNGIDEDCDGVDFTSSTHEISNVILNIFPNPTSDYINISTTGQLDYQVSLFDLQGKVLHLSFNSESINIRDFTNGTYVLEIQDLKTNKKVLERIVIAH